VIRVLVDGMLTGMSERLDQVYAESGRPSIPPGRMPRTLLLQIFFSVRSGRMLMQQLDYNLLFRWLAGLEIGDRYGIMRCLLTPGRLTRGRADALGVEEYLSSVWD
jgi:transposase